MTYDWAKEITLTGTADGEQTDYQLAMTLHKGEGEDSSTDVYLNNHTLTDWDDTHCPTDFRFTNSASDELMDYWVESYTATTVDVWVEFDTIPVAPGTATFRLYYGLADAASFSSGADTFITFDDFERDNDFLGNGIGGDWTVTIGQCRISEDQAFSGTRSGMIGGTGVVGACTIPRVAGSGYTVRLRVFKPDDTDKAEFYIHGNGTKKTAMYAPVDDHVYYYAGGWQDTGTVIAVDDWDLFSVQNYLWGATFTYDILHNDAIIVAGADMYNSATSAHVVTLDNYDLTVGHFWYVDDFIVKNFTVNAPEWTSWGEEEIRILPPPTLFTGTLVGTDNVDLSWTPSPYADNTVIVRRLDHYPTSVTDGTLVYSGPLTEFTDVVTDTEVHEFFYGAWSVKAPSKYSTSYATLEIGGETMANAILLIPLLGILAGVTVYGDVRRNWPMILSASFGWFLTAGWTMTTSDAMWDGYFTIGIVSICIALGTMIWPLVTKPKASAAQEVDEDEETLAEMRHGRRSSKALLSREKR